MRWLGEFGRIKIVSRVSGEYCCPNTLGLGPWAMDGDYWDFGLLMFSLWWHQQLLIKEDLFVFVILLQDVLVGLVALVAK